MKKKSSFYVMSNMSVIYYNNPINLIQFSQIIYIFASLFNH